MPNPKTTTARSGGPRQAVQARPSYEDDIIVISSDDEDAPPVVPRKRLQPKKPLRQQSKANAKSPHGEEVDISSDDEEGKRRRSSRTVAEMEKQIQKLKEENELLRKQQAMASPATNQREERLAPKADPRYTALLDALDDCISCDICAGKMWVPATLACGHAFCQSCLQNWFSTALMKHLAIYPQYIMYTPRVRQLLSAAQRQVLSENHRRLLELEAYAELQKQPQPDYTCPACREPVKGRPAEAFPLKSVVRAVAKEVGEEEPRGTAPQPAGRRANDGPWDGFFFNVHAV
ncbi:hypothetical protein BXZ70DRAFT_36633 [Cristinia sonorae]|uniref:RING-type domain-containing protein n=1 Tax=Cristinia sonorae TaxID=1940300 RepID=A0A8K0UYR0_9AGAR|nr:hypothetical protein BXZ70DRAFT_36633 [Cristinia sonorae]